MSLTSKAFKQSISAGAREQPSTDPRCPHAGECGGCAFQERAYSGQVAAKTAVLRQLWGEQLADTAAAELAAVLDVVPSPDPYEYRTRMDYVATKGRFGLRKPGRFNFIVELETCHLIPPAAFQAAQHVWQHALALGLPDYNIRTHEGFLRYVVVRRSAANQLLLAAVTAEGDDVAAMEELAALALAQPGVLGFHWLINDSMSDLSFGALRQHWGAALLPMPVGDLTLHIGANTFFQNNVHLLLPLFEAVREAVTTQPDAAAQTVADLYSGVGAIALHLARHVGSVIGVESHPESAALGQHNIAANGAANVALHAQDVLDFLRTQAAERFATVVADPPRIGLGAEVCAELLRLRPRRIVYVSCNPLTQCEDVRRLLAGYRLVSLRGYDMFPHTPHVEGLAVLDARDTLD
jgi:23S rRNA (uracil-5-)-methyltransferase RumA